MAQDFETRFVGLTMPIRKGPAGFFSLAGTKDVIHSDIMQLLTTQLNERVTLPQFGSKLYQLCFEQNDKILITQAQRFVIDAIRTWEHRITLTTTNVTTDEHQFTIHIEYTINETAESDSLVVVFARGI